MTAKDSSSSATSRAETSETGGSASAQGVDLVGAGLLPPLAAAFLHGRSLELLRPLEFLAPGDLPRVRASDIDRRAVAEALAVANAAYAHPGAEALGEKLADPKTAVIVTGQQTGLFGGPLYTLSKAVAATLWAERLEAAGQPAAAVFWMATEDHDYGEVSRASFPVSGGLLELDLALDDDTTPLMPVGMRVLGPKVEQALDDLRAAMPGDRFSSWIEQLSGWYRPDARFGEAFARLMVALLGERCPLLLDAMLPAIKDAEKPWLEAIASGHREFMAAYAERDREIVASGFDLQVEPQPGANPLFYLHGMERRRVVIDGDSVRLRGLEGFGESLDWLLAAVRENPAVVSPGVLARPAVQDAVLGTTLQILGPGEVSYMPQVAPLYEHLGIQAPAMTLRPQLVALGRHQLEKLASTGLSLAQLVLPDFDLDRALGGGRGRALVSEAVRDVEARLDRLQAEVLAIDRTLESPLARTRDRIRGSLEAFAGKIDRAIARKDEVTRQRALALRTASMPKGRLQERVVSSAFFPGKYGDKFVEACFEQLDLDSRRLSVIELG